MTLSVLFRLVNDLYYAALKRIFGLGGTLVGPAIRIATKIRAYTYAIYVNRLPSRPQGRIKEP